MRAGGGAIGSWSWIGRHAWVALAAFMFVATLAAQALPTSAIDWQPDLAWREPWRWWTALFVHFSRHHLVANLLGVGLIALLGASARVPARVTLAWAVAWPLTHLALLVEPGLRHYGGLSGVMHAAVAVVCMHLLTRPAQRWIGACLFTGLLAKLLSESPWAGPVQHLDGWDIGVAPIAHATGVAAGVLCAVAGELGHRHFSSRHHD